MYYEAARDSLLTLLSSTERAQGKILLTDSESILLLTNYISFTALLELGFLDVIVLDRLRASDKSFSFNPALSLMQVVVIVSNLALVDQKILSPEAAALYGADVIKAIDLIVLQQEGNRLIQKLLRFDENGPSRINRLYFSTINYFCHADGMFYCHSSPKNLPSETADWTTDDFRYVHKAVEALVNVCGNAIECTRGKSAESETSSPGELVILTPTTGKTPEVVANLVKDAWELRIKSRAPDSASGGGGGGSGGGSGGGGGGGLCYLVILDRSDDPIVPCLLPWTYLGMIQEYLKLDATGLLTLEDGSQANLSFTDDSFFRENYNSNYGDLTSLLSSPPALTSATSIQDFERAKKARSEFELHSKIVHQITDILESKQIFAIWKIEQAILQAASITKNDAIINGMEELTNMGTVRSSAIHRLIKLIKIKCRYILNEDYPNAPWIQWTPDAEPTADCPLLQAFYQNVAYKVANRIGLKNSEYIPLTHRIINSLIKGQMPPKMVSTKGQVSGPLTNSNIVVLMIGPTYQVEGPQKSWKTIQVGGLYL